jgi:hypothetical protein
MRKYPLKHLTNIQVWDVSEPYVHDINSSSICSTDAMRKQRQPDFKVIMPVCSQTGAGISELWNELLSCARINSEPPNGTGPGSEFAVREHVRAKQARVVK